MEADSDSFGQVVIIRLDTPQSSPELFISQLFHRHFLLVTLRGFGFFYFSTEAALSPLLSKIPLYSSLCRITVLSAIGSLSA